MSSCASWPAESRHSFGPACSVCTLIRSISSLAAAAGSDRGAQVALELPAEGDEQPDRVQREHRGELPAIPARGGHDEQRDRPFDPVDCVELLAGYLQPCRGGDPP